MGNSIIRLLVLVIFGFLIVSCTDSDDNSNKGTVFDTQVNAYKKSKEVEGMLNDAQNQKKKNIDEQTE